MPQLELEQRAAEVIKNINYLNLATVTPENQAWNTPLFFGLDKELNLYWVSGKTSQHVINLKNSPSSYATVYDSTLPVGQGFGVYLQGKSSQITELKELAQAVLSIYSRQDKKVKAIQYFLKTFPRRVYKTVPEKVWANGLEKREESNVDIRLELNLNKLKQYL